MDKIVGYVKKRLREFQQECKMYRKLKKVVPADCHSELLKELLFDPIALRRRYASEANFQISMGMRWK